MCVCVCVCVQSFVAVLNAWQQNSRLWLNINTPASIALARRLCPMQDKGAYALHLDLFKQSISNMKRNQAKDVTVLHSS